MYSAWPKVALRDVLRLDLDRVTVDPTETYAMVGVYSFGRGLFHKEPVAGNSTSYKFFYRLKADHVVLSQLFGWEGALALSSREFEGLYVSPQFPTFLCDTNWLDRQFLGWLLRKPSFWADLGTRTKGMGDRRRTVSPDAFLSSTIPLPPLAEQRRIVVRIEELAAKVEAARALRQQATEKTETLVRAQAGNLLSCIDADLTELRDWLDSNRDGIQTGPFGAQLGSGDFIDTGIPVLTIGNIQYNGLKIDSLQYVSDGKAKQLKRYSVREGDILFARMGTVGRCCVVPQEAEGWLINYHIIRVALDRSRVEPRFIHWIIQTSADVSDYLDQNIRGATRHGVNSRIVGSLPCRVPPLDEQRRIVAYLDDLQARVDAVKQHQAATAAALNALLPSILDQAFKGEL